MGSALLERPEAEIFEAENPGIESADSRPITMAEMLRTRLAATPLSQSPIDWKVVGWMTLMHLGCLAAPFYFSWSALGVAFVLWQITGCLGICLCYHRFLSHRGFKLAKPVEFLMQLAGVWALQGGPITWSVTHRVHHARSDKEGDPHSPRDGKWWSHLLWLFVDRTESRDTEFRERIVPDLMRDPMSRFFERTFFLWTVLLAGALYAIGGMPWLIWGLCVRMVFTYHATWFVNSATHLWGYRNYETTDDSRNNWWVALLTNGEGWHNNHHAYPRIARSGHKWWEIDTTYWVIYALKKTGLAWDVKDQLPNHTRRASPSAVSA